MIAILFAALILGVCPALAEDVNALEGTLVRLVQKKKDINERLDDSLRQKRTFERESARIDGIAAAINRDIDTLNADIAQAGRTACTGTYTNESERAALEARCAAAKVPLQARKEEIETRQSQLAQQDKYLQTVLQPREELRAKQAQALLEENRANDAQIDFIKKRIELAKQAGSRGDCVQSCLARASLDAQSQCLQVCFDKASPNLGPPPWSPFDK
jgi:chromosome segregation ATPase